LKNKLKKKRKKKHITHSRVVIESLSIYNNRVYVNLVHASSNNNNNNTMMMMRRGKKSKRHDFFFYLFSFLYQKLIQMREMTSKLRYY